MKRYVLGFLGLLAVAAAVLYFAGTFDNGGERRLKLGQTVRTGAFGFALENLKCHLPLSVIPAKQRHEYPLGKLRGEICFGAVRLTGPLNRPPPLIIGSLFVGRFIYPSLTNVTDAAHGTESSGYANVIVNMVFAIPSENVPTELKMAGLDQSSPSQEGRRLFSVRYVLPL